MDKKIYVIRHANAEGQETNARLTEKGQLQAQELMGFLRDVRVDRIISSPFLRAQQTISPFADMSKVVIEIDQRLGERVLSSINMPDWMEKLKASFEDLDLVFEGGESSLDAMNRAVSVINEVLCSNAGTSIIVTHGNLMSLLLKYYNQNFGFNEWKSLTNPDVFVLHFKHDEVMIERVWKES